MDSFPGQTHRGNSTAKYPSLQTDLIRCPSPTAIIYAQSPASYGVQTFDGYLELLARGAPLPAKTSEGMESIWGD
jgi:hypothetical protein